MDFMQEMWSEHVDAIVTSKATPRSNARYQNTVSGALFLIIRRKKFVQPSHLTLFIINEEMIINSSRTKLI